jgi:UPF0716 protein FxsA
VYGGFGRRFLVALAIAILVGVAEVALLIVVGQEIGWAWTLLLVLATTLLGAWVLRREGPRSWRAFRADLREGRPPGASVTDGLLVLVGAILMVLPGFISDLIGALLVAPPTRRLAGRGAQAILTRRLTPTAATTLFGPRTVRVRTGSPQPAPPPASEPPIEGEIIDR